MSRRYSIDVLRVISALAVIIIHVVTAPVHNATGEVSVSLRANLNLVHTLMLWAIPVFFMITGYCLMMKQECTYKYCFSHVLKYIGVLFTVGLFYSLLEEVFMAKTMNAAIVIKSVFNVITGDLWDHMWFIYSIIGIYLVMPIIHCFMQQGEKNILILTGLLFFFTILCPSMEEYISIGVEFPFGGFLFYVCFGGMISKCKVNKRLLLFSGLIGGLSVVYVIVADNHVLNYTYLPVCLIAMSIFSIVSQLNMKPNKLVLKVSECTFGIYLIQPLFVNIALKLLRIDLLSNLPGVRLCVFATLIFAASLVTTYVLRKIPVVKKLF